jgi:hypothetical protein
MKKLEHETMLIRLCCKVFCPIGLGHTYNNRLHYIYLIHIYGLSHASVYTSLL